MREDSGPAYAAADGVYRQMADVSHHGGNSGKAEKDKPRGIDRYLKKDKEALRLKGKSLAKPLASLKSRIPIRAFYPGEERKTPGFRQTGTVHHCGQATSGQYILTLAATDAASGWICLYSLLNKAHKWTFQSLTDIKASVPLPVLEFHSGNGSEFISNATEIRCGKEKLPFTRSRDHKKNDNCFAGQKNGAAVRFYFFYFFSFGLQNSVGQV
jgi:hypothetical protein